MNNTSLKLWISDVCCAPFIEHTKTLEAKCWSHYINHRMLYL